jgi:hypothetical protein
VDSGSGVKASSSEQFANPANALNSAVESAAGDGDVETMGVEKEWPQQGGLPLKAQRGLRA